MYRTKIRQSRKAQVPRVVFETSLLSRPRGAVGSGAAAVEFAADSVVALSCGCLGGFGWGFGLNEVRLCDPCVPRVRPCIYRSRVCPVSPRCLFEGARVFVLVKAELAAIGIVIKFKLLIHKQQTT